MKNSKENMIWKKIGKGVFVIAEIGKNFIQSKEEKLTPEYLRNAKKLVKLAKESGADAVKFQTHNVEDEQLNIDITSPHFSGSDRYNWVKRNDHSTPLSFWKKLKKYCDDLDIIFFSTPMSRGAAMKLNEVGVCLWKVGSGDILDFVMLDYIAKTKKPILISAGMSTLEETDKAIEFLKKRTKRIAILHCISKYPCPPEELNLKTISFFKKRYSIPVGFSDHSVESSDSVIAAVNMGATVVEKHFSLDRNLWGSDHKASITPREFGDMVKRIKNGEKIKLENYGREGKFLFNDEAVFRPIFRKSLVAARDIKKGEIISPEMIYAMRPQKYIKGLPSEKYEDVLGKKSSRNLKKYASVRKAFLEK